MSPNVTWLGHMSQSPSYQQNLPPCSRAKLLLFQAHWRRLFRVPWTARRTNQSILKEINPEYSLEALMIKRKLQSFGHLLQITDSGKDRDTGKDCRQDEKGMTEDEVVGWHHQLNVQEFEPTPGNGEGQGILVCCSS